MGPRAKKKIVLSVGEINNLREEKAELEVALSDADGYGAGTAGEQIDKSKIKAQIAHFDREIEAGSPGRITGKTKDSLYREERELEERFVKGLPTRWEMDMPHKNPGSVRKHQAWLAHNQKTGYVERYRQIQRTLRPGEEKSIEALRKDR